LTEDQIGRKEVAVQAHESQYGYCRTYLDSFVRTDELFGDFAAVRLPRARQAAFSVRLDAPAMEPAEELEEEERAQFVGAESHTVRLVGDQLEFAVGLSRPLGPRVTASYYCFGYRSDRPFADMPKLHAEVGDIGQRVADQGRALPEDVVDVRHTARAFQVRVPMAVLGWPQRVLVGAVTRLGDIPLGTLPWRVIELPAAESIEAEPGEDT
jgi:hypothetical protein